MGKKLFEIWVAGFRETGYSGEAFMLGKGVGTNFDEAVEDYIARNPGTGVKKVTTRNFSNEQAYNNRQFNWHLRLSGLYDNAAEARKSFG